MTKSTRWITRVGIPLAIIAGLAGLAWYELRPSGLGDGFASGNGRIEATEVDVATKLGGRVAAIDVEEGDFVDAGLHVASATDAPWAVAGSTGFEGDTPFHF